MNWREAILLTLEELKEPVTSIQVWAYILEQKYSIPNSGKTPDRTVAGQLCTYSKDPYSGIKRKEEKIGRAFLYYLTNNESKLKGVEKIIAPALEKKEPVINEIKNEKIRHSDTDEIESSSSTDNDGVEKEDEELQPFDPEKISIDTKPITMETCLRRLEQRTIVLSPDFQRNEVWDIRQKSRLIESIMLKIPIPMFYVSSDEVGVYSVVDGLQRLSTIRSFILGDDYLLTKEIRFKGEGFKLKDLEFWGDKYNNRNFNSLPANMQNRILETVFTFTIINPGTPEDVKRNVFKRINTGGEPLKTQEIRHALYSGKSTELLLRLSKLPEFLEATANSVKSKRMMDRELILRFLSFKIRNYIHYPKNNDMDAFLSDTMRIINIMPELPEKEAKKIAPDDELQNQVVIRDANNLERLFVNAMVRAKAIFEAHTFRKSYGGKNKSPINKSLFEVWSVLLSNLSEREFASFFKNTRAFLNEYEHLLNDTNFINAISRDSWKFIPGVRYRYEHLTKLLNQFIHD